MKRRRFYRPGGGTASVALLSLLLLAADKPVAPADYAADARSLAGIVNANYAYLERLPGRRFSLSPKLTAEAEQVADGRSLVRFSERALALLADHHAITGNSRSDSWALFPSYGDLWIERRDAQFMITAVRDASPSASAGVRPGDHLLAIDGQPTAAAVAAFWDDLGVAGGGERDAYAARVLAAGQRNRPRKLTIGNLLSRPRELELPNLYVLAPVDRPVLKLSEVGQETVIKFNDSLGSDATIAAFDLAMTKVRLHRRLILDLTDTPGGGNTSVARAILGWFVARPAYYQVHNFPAEERRTGIARQWVEQVLPRPGKYWGGPVTVRVGRWTGSMGEGLAVGFHTIGKRVEGDRMAGLLGAIYDYRFDKSGQLIKFPSERLSAVDGTPRERFVPARPGKR